MELIKIAAAIVIGFFAFRYLFRRETVFQYERGLLYRYGRFVRILDPGAHWIYVPSTSIRKIDVRPRFVSVPSQEVLSSDGITLKISVAAEYSITDPDRAVNKVQSFSDALYLSLQLSLREIVGKLSVDELMASRGAIGAQLITQCAPRAEEIGLKLSVADVKDIMFPGDLKKMFAQVVNARKEGLAALEKARGETAALRNLANAARIAEKNPSLLQLRIIQSMDASKGNTYILGLPTTSTPIPLKGGGAESVLPESTEEGEIRGEQ
jgi:regulator of protease activity HflC (stomatin/prohibitin superfamily)